MTDVFAAPVADRITEPKRDRFGRPFLLDPRTGEGAYFTRATTLARTLADEWNINEWQKRLVARGMGLRPELVALAATLDPDDPADRKEYADQIVAPAFDAAGGNIGHKRGTAMHAATAMYDRGTPLSKIPEMFRRDVTAYARALEEGKLQVGNLGTFIEVLTVAPGVNSAGTADRLMVESDGRLIVLDLKTQKDHPEMYNALDISIQLSVYARGLHDHGVWIPGPHQEHPGSWSGALPEVDLTRAIVAWLPWGAGRCELIEVDIASGWTYAQAAMRVRQWRLGAKSLVKTYVTALAPVQATATYNGDGLIPATPALPAGNDVTAYLAGSIELVELSVNVEPSVFPSGNIEMIDMDRAGNSCERTDAHRKHGTCTGIRKADAEQAARDPQPLGPQVLRHQNEGHAGIWARCLICNPADHAAMMEAVAPGADSLPSTGQVAGLIATAFDIPVEAVTAPTPTEALALVTTEPESVYMNSGATLAAGETISEAPAVTWDPEYTVKPDADELAESVNPATQVLDELAARRAAAPPQVDPVIVLRGQIRKLETPADASQLWQANAALFGVDPSLTDFVWEVLGKRGYARPQAVLQ